MMPERNHLLSHEEEQHIRALLSAEANCDEPGAPQHIEKSLLAELHRRRRSRVISRVTGAGAVAATVLVGLMLSRPEQPSKRTPEQPAMASVQKAEVALPLILKKDGVAATPIPRSVRPHRRLSVQAKAPAVPPVETASEFLPVGTWQALEPMERGSIIRVRMPKAALPRLGIPVSGDRWNEFIPADVVLGEDGSMRAIRLISTRQ